MRKTQHSLFSYFLAFLAFLAFLCILVFSYKVSLRKEKNRGLQHTITTIAVEPASEDLDYTFKSEETKTSGVGTE